VVDREKIIDGRTIAPGDTVLGLPSVGLHTNGYSLARKLFFEIAACAPDAYLGALNATIGEALLRPHASYLRVLEGLLDGGLIKGLAHITGGGLTENIPRILPEGTNVEIQIGSWPVLPVFEVMQQIGNVAEAEMFRTFNMGVGMVIVGAESDAAKIKAHVESSGDACYQIGRVTRGDQRVSYVR
ncbi:MAG TPA: AIR synthase-related protein, partial [Pyrinomonadaceae bacterium]|nr:AIR synthase-related protein [Pyrinomonadaceae bacterium]